MTIHSMISIAYFANFHTAYMLDRFNKQLDPAAKIIGMLVKDKSVIRN